MQSYRQFVPADQKRNMSGALAGAALRNDRIDAPCLFDRPINGERFRA
jgi:hypothetical protein